MPIPKNAALDVLSVSELEKVDASLLAITWQYESHFGYNPSPHARLSDGVVTGYDVGPMQLATGLWNKSPYTDGLANAFGSWFARHGGANFDGNSFENLRVGARALLDGAKFSNTRPSSVSELADEAGIFRAGPQRKGSYQTRVNEFNSWQGRYDTFFKCMRNNYPIVPPNFVP